jgi:hypothetical protein
MKKLIQQILLIAPAMAIIVSAASAADDLGRANRINTAQPNRASYMIGISAQAPIAVPVISRAADNSETIRAAGDTANNALAGEDLAAARAAAEVLKTKCTANNAGMGGTFIWASKDARNVPNYAVNGIQNVGHLVEDAANPANNTCFVRVELSSSQSGVNLSSIPYAYFAENDTISCGSWASKSAVEEKILAASSTSRTLGTIGGALGGAAIGFVGSDYAFANTFGNEKDSAWHHQGHLDDASKKEGADRRALICSNLVWAKNHDEKNFPNMNRDLAANIETCKTPGHDTECAPWRELGEWFEGYKLFNGGKGNCAV